MKIKYVDLGGVSKEMYTGLWEYDNVVDLKEPILIKFSTNKTLVSFWQGPYWNEESQEWESVYSDLSDYFYSSELSDIFKVRLYEKLEIPYNADMVYYVESPDVTDFLLFYPDSHSSFLFVISCAFCGEINFLELSDVAESPDDIALPVIIF